MMISDAIAQPGANQTMTWVIARGDEVFLHRALSHCPAACRSGQAREPHIRPDSVRIGGETFSVKPEMG